MNSDPTHPPPAPGPSNPTLSIDPLDPPSPAAPSEPSGLALQSPPSDPHDPALQTAAQVRAAAEQFTQAADAYHRRLKTEAAQLPSGEVFARLQEEQRLRGVANQLYFEASARTLAFALEDQAALVATLTAAADQVAAFHRFEQVTALVTDLLVLGGAIVSGKMSPVVYALQEVRADLKAG